MVYRPQNAPTPLKDCHVERVTDKDGFEDAMDVCIQAFDYPADLILHAYPATMLNLPGFDYFLARRHGEPRSSVMSFRHGPFVGIYAMATPQQHRRQGIGRAVLEYLIAYHLERGATTFYLEATEAGYPLYDKVGFRTVDVAAVWLTGVSTQFS
jgi:GNAT superfamily N-acetyltransferase